MIHIPPQLTRYVEHLVTQQEAESNELQAQVDKLEAENDYAADKCLAMEAQVDELKGQNEKTLRSDSYRDWQESNQ